MSQLGDNSQHAEGVLQPQTISFMDLPAEIRNNVYHLTVSKDEEALNFQYLPPMEAALRRLEKAFEQPAITRTSKVVRQESLPVFYGTNKFTINLVCNSKEASIKWLKCIGPENRKMLHDCWAWCCKCNHTALDDCWAWCSKCNHSALDDRCTCSTMGRYVGDYSVEEVIKHLGREGITAVAGDFKFSDEEDVADECGYAKIRFGG